MILSDPLFSVCIRVKLYKINVLIQKYRKIALLLTTYLATKVQKAKVVSLWLTHLTHLDTQIHNYEMSEEERVVRGAGTGGIIRNHGI